MPLVAFDIQHPELVAHELDEANRRLARSDEVPPSMIALVEDLCEEIADADSEALAGIDPYLWIELQSTALKALGGLHDDDPRSQRRLVRISLEQLRFLLTRLAERQVVREDEPAKEVARWLDTALGVPQQRKAALLGVGERTYQRWISESDATSPSSEEERRLRLIARITNQLRHGLTGMGVVDWLEHPRDELQGRRPVDVLDDPDVTPVVLELAVGSRSGVAA